MDESIEYWQEKLSEYQEALESEFDMLEEGIGNEEMVVLLKWNISQCQDYIEWLK